MPALSVGTVAGGWCVGGTCPRIRGCLLQGFLLKASGGIDLTEHCLKYVYDWAESFCINVS